MSGTTDWSPSGRGCSHGGKRGGGVREEEEKDVDELADNTCVSDIQTLIRTQIHPWKGNNQSPQWRLRPHTETSSYVFGWTGCGETCALCQRSSNDPDVSELFFSTRNAGARHSRWHARTKVSPKLKAAPH